MNRTHDPFYDQVNARFHALSGSQQASVRQRVRQIKAIIAPSIYPMAIDSATNLELTGAPPPDRCPDHPITGRIDNPNRFCAFKPVGPIIPTTKSYP